MPDGEVVKSALKIDASHLHDPKPSSLRAVIDGQLFEHYDAVGNRVQLHVVLLRRKIVEQNHSRFAARKKMLEREDLATVSEGAASSLSSDRLSRTMRAGAKASTRSKIICVVSLSSISAG
jgi:hypothetical protein